MKIRYLSDLHLEFDRQPIDYLPKLPAIGEDVVVLAGDIHAGLNGIRWAQRRIRDRPVIYVLGNHEFYNRDWDGLIDEARELARGSNVHILENDSVVIGNIRFVGATLWTDFNLFGPALRYKAARNAQSLLTDFHAIRHGQEWVKPAAMIERCEESVAYIRDTVATSAEGCVVVTHHSPSLANENPQFRGDLSGAAFHSRLDALLMPPVLSWISGHTHHSCTTEVNGIQLLSNQRGYPREGVPFSWDAMVEVPR